MKNIFSHPGIPLIEHLKKVAENTLNLSTTNNLNFCLDSHIISELLFICGYFHDIGKATSFFQEYLRNPDKPTSDLKNHSLPSAVFVFYFTQRYLENKNLSDDEVYLYSELCFIIVKRHHGSLGDFDKETTLKDGFKNLCVQFDSIDPVSIQEIISYSNKRLEIDLEWRDFIDWFKDDGYKKDTGFKLITFYSLSFKNWEKSRKSETYYLFLWMYGVLLFSDKSDVILAGGLPGLQDASLEYLTKYRELNRFEKAQTKINQLKNQAYFSVLTSINEDFDRDNRFYSITLPTGLGKTLTSLGAALKLKELLGNENSKIIIAIPFTSIIDQNYDVYNDVFQNPNNALLLKHHHLAEPKYKENENNVRNIDESQYLIETWQSSVVVTTFVQLLETLITNDKSKVLKIPSLTNSIIILDEVQQIPHQLWELVRQAFFSVTEHLNCYIILMSATQPLIFRPKEEIKELVPNHKDYFSFFNRTKLVNRTKKTITLDDFGSEVILYADKYKQEDILIILNTKKATLDTYRLIETSVESRSNEVYYLTTLLTPYERKKIIGKIKQAGSKRKIIVSTQLVEAGVDISVHTVYRALAPIDSIIQAAGRANRYNEKEAVSKVFLYNIDELSFVTNRIYGSALMQKTKNVLSEYDEISENKYLQLIEAYFDEVKDLSIYSENTFLKELLALNFEETGKFKLIEDSRSESVFIDLNKEAKIVWNKYMDLKENVTLNSFEKKKIFSEFKSTFYDFVVNINVRYDESSIGLPFEPTYGFYYIDVENQEIPIYNRNQDMTLNREGYVFEGIKVLSF